MKLTPAEERFLQAWMYDELHFMEGTGPAKRLRRDHGAVPADLAAVIAAWLPDPEEQYRRAQAGRLPDAPPWP